MIAIIFTSVLLTLVIAVTDYSQQNLRGTSKRVNDQSTLRLAEAGIEKAVWCLNNPANTSNCPGNPNYSGETSTALGNGSFSVTVTGTGNSRTLESTGTVSGSGGTSSQQLRLTLTTTTTEASFFYGVQVGAGGLIMGNNAEVVGNVYSNGSIIAGNNAKVRGSAIVAGGTLLTPDQQQNNQTSDFAVGETTSQTDAGQSFRAGQSNIINKVSLYVRKVGNPSNATVRIIPNNAGSPATTELASGTLNASQVTTSYGWIDVPLTTNPALVDGTTYWIVFDVGSSNANHYFFWGRHDNSGYGNGVGKYTTNWTSGSWSDADGDFGFRTFMGGVETKIDNLTVPKTASAVVKAHTIEDSDIGTGTGPGVDTYCTNMRVVTPLDVMEVSGNVQCGTITTSTIAGNVTAENVTGSTISGTLTCETQSGNSVSGTINCPTSVDPPADPPQENLPLSQANINQWKSEAQAGGTISGDVNVTTSQSLGPTEITGSLNMTSNNIILTVTGTIYVHGNIAVTNNSAIRCAAAYGPNSCVVLADGWIDIANNGTFAGSGDPDSFVMLLSTSDCNGAGPNCTAGGAAIDVHNSATGVIFYAAYGKALIHNTVAVTEVTAYTLELDNTATVNYNLGLSSTGFASGPGASWTYRRGTYQILD